MKKIKLFVFALCAIFVTAVTVNAAATDVYSDSMLQQPVGATGSDTYVGSQPQPVISSNDGNKHVTVTFNAGDFKIVAGNQGIDGAWPGIKILAPKDYDFSNVGEEPNKGPIYYSNGDRSNKKYFKNNQDTPSTDQSDYTKDHFLYSYFAITEEFLETAVEKEAQITYYLEFDWDANGSIDQTITVIIDPAGVTLADSTGDNQLWNEDTYEDKVEDLMDKVYTELEGAIDTAKGIDTSKYTEESVKALEEAVAAAEAAGKDVTKNNQSAVRALKNAITTAIANLVATNGSSVTPSDKPVADPQQKPEEESPNTYDGGLTYIGLALGAIGASAISVKKLRNN